MANKMAHRSVIDERIRFVST